MSQVEPVCENCAYVGTRLQPNLQRTYECRKQPFLVCIPVAVTAQGVSVQIQSMPAPVHPKARWLCYVERTAGMAPIDMTPKPDPPPSLVQ